MNKAMGLLAAGVLVMSAGAHAAVVAHKSVTYDFTFDGFCDGMSLTVTDGLYVVGKSTGCFTGGVNEGFVVAVHEADPEAGTRALVIVLSSNNFGPGTTASYIINLKARTWADYITSDGVTQYENHTGALTFIKH